MAWPRWLNVLLPGGGAGRHLWFAGWPLAFRHAEGLTTRVIFGLVAVPSPAYGRPGGPADLRALLLLPARSISTLSNTPPTHPHGVTAATIQPHNPTRNRGRPGHSKMKAAICSATSDKEFFRVRGTPAIKRENSLAFFPRCGRLRGFDDFVVEDAHDP